jgi:hypothetical protein
MGMKVIGVPKTIDNDIDCTDYTFGFDTAVQIATEAIDRLHTTAESHRRAMVVEVMGRHAGWIATHAAAGWLRGIPESEAAHSVERLTRVSENTIQYEATIDDPNVYTRPWTLAFPLNKDERYRIFEYACHEGNHALENMLRMGSKP